MPQFESAYFKHLIKTAKLLICVCASAYDSYEREEDGEEDGEVDGEREIVSCEDFSQRSPRENLTRGMSVMILPPQGVKQVRKSSPGTV